MTLATTPQIPGESAAARWALAAGRPLWQIAIIVIAIYHIPLESTWSHAVLVVGAAIFVADDLLLSSNIDHIRWPAVQLGVLYGETAVATFLALMMIFLFPQGPFSVLLIPTMLTFARLRRAAAGTAISTLAAITVLLYLISLRIMPWPSGAAGSVTDLLFCLYGVVALFGWIVAWMARTQWQEREALQEMVVTLKRQSEQLGRINEQVNGYANRVYDLAAAEERNRIAGEIHDTVAHRLTALLVQLQGARRMMEAGDLVSATDNFHVAEELARESLDEVRQSVRAIRRHAGDEGVEALRKLSLQYASLTGMTVSFHLENQVEGIPARLMAVLYRVVQEGLTNAQRHGRATQVDIFLLRTGVNLALRIVDNGKGAVKPELGFGLSSMRNRLMQYGGDIFVTSQPGSGFQLELTLPLWEG